MTTLELLQLENEHKADTFYEKGEDMLTNEKGEDVLTDEETYSTL